MFNGYNDTPLISYEFSQERVEKKYENVPKWSYGHDVGVQPGQTQANNRHAEFWTGKSNLLGIPNVVKCNCTSCYPSTEKKSYQCDTTRHRLWLPRTFPVPVNGSNEPCKLPACQWDSMLTSQGSCYPESSFPYVQESEGKYSYYKHRQISRLVESNQPGVITSVKNVEYSKKSKNELPAHGQEPSLQNGTRQPVFFSPSYSLKKRIDGRNYCDPVEKFSNVASYSLDQHIPRLPVVEPFSKAVPSNISQSRVPSTGYRSVKENVPQSYVDTAYRDGRKICTEPEINCDQRNEAFSGGQVQAGVHEDYSHFNHDLGEAEPEKLFFDNSRHPDYYSRSNFQDVIKRNSQTLDNRKDCAMHEVSEMIMSEQHYNVSRSKHQEAGSVKPSYDVFYSKDFEKVRPENHPPANSACFQRNDDAKNENINVHSRLHSSALLFNDPRFADRTQNTFTCQSTPVAYRNYIRPEYTYQGYNTQARYAYPAELQGNDSSQYRAAPQQQLQSCEQLTPQQGSGFIYDPHYQPNTEKAQQPFKGKNPSPVQADTHNLENRNPTYLETIRSEELNKNGSSKISPLRLLRKKKFINVPQEPTPVSTLDTIPGLDVRKFWSTWAEEEEENAGPTQMVVLDCQNIDPEQAKLLHLYDTDPIRSIHFETNNTVIKNTDFVKESTSETANCEEVKTCEQLAREINEESKSKSETEIPLTQQEETEKLDESNSMSLSGLESRPENVESNYLKTASNRSFKKPKSGQESRERKKSEIMDKWTEKKFDFLKRAEESKAAEVLRHEEEKKKIFETRLSIQQGLKKNENLKNVKREEESVLERLPLDENSHSNSPNQVTGNVVELPTSEYRKNKFLDYSDRKLILNGEQKTERGEVEDKRSPTSDETELYEIKKEESERSDKWSNKNTSDKLFPPFNTNFNEEAGFEMDDILKRMSEINFQCTDVKLENGLGHGGRKKLKSSRKLKRRKSDHHSENEERADKLTVETVTKPTIKFSIQKSHDLKISFKVLNSSKDYSDEDLVGEGTEETVKTMEDSKNSTELITLKYKSIKRDGERRPTSDSKKNGKAFKRKKQTPKVKTPVLKIKKGRCTPQEERDPLANDDDDDDDDDPTKKCPSSDGFQVKEAMDSAKIKLTFKRHKGNIEREYKTSSNNVGKLSDVYSGEEENEKEVEMAMDRRAEEHEIFAEAGVETFNVCPVPTSDVESFGRKPDFESILEEVSKNNSTSRDSYCKEEKCDSQSEPPTLHECSPEPHLAMRTPEDKENSNLSEETGKRDGMDTSMIEKKWKEDSKCSPSLVDFALNDVINCKDDNASEDKLSELPILGSNSPPDVGLLDESKGKKENFEEEKILDVSFDFIGSTETQEINAEKSVESETPKAENCGKKTKGENHALENQDEIKTPEKEDSSSMLNSEKGDDCDMACVLKNSEFIAEDSESGNELTDLRSPGSEEHSVIPSLDLESEIHVDNSAVSEQKREVIFNEKINEMTLKKSTEPCPVEEADDGNYEKKTSLQAEFYENSFSNLDAGDIDSNNLFENLSRDYSKCDFTGISSTSKTSPKYISVTDVRTPVEVECKEIKESVGKSLNDQTQLEEYAFVGLEVLLQKPAENPEAVMMKSRSTGCCLFGNSSSFVSLKNNADILPIKITMECPNVDFLPLANTSPESLVTAVQDVQPSSISAEQLEDRSHFTLSSAAKSANSETASEGTNNPSTNMKQSEAILKENEKEGKIVVHAASNMPLSPKVSNLGPLATEHDSGCAECSFLPEEDNNEDEKADNVVANGDEDLEDGEIIDIEADESPPVHLFDTFPNVRENIEFVVRKIERRNSINLEKQNKRRMSETTCSRKIFSKAKSCPAELVFSELQLDKEESPLYIPVESIPLPLGPPPYESCFDLTKYLNKCRSRRNRTETTEKSKGWNFSRLPQVDLPACDSILRSNDLEYGRKCSPPVNDCEGTRAPRLGLLERNSKIKFSFLKRSKFSKIGLKTGKDSKLSSQGQDSEADKSENFKIEKGLKIGKLNCMRVEPGVIPQECQIAEVPNGNVPVGMKEMKHSEYLESVSEKPVELSCGDLHESVEVVDAMSDFIRNEFYECEDIPTSEDLTNGEDPEIEKVNDDKFRNIMQNCLDNAKKFLNVGNLKLFSCSVDDLLELDCQDSESFLGENDPEKPNNHVSRDVLLASCEETNDELDLSDNVQPADISIDFVPSFCSDVCPEILPLDNWPYLEEEVTSSPATKKTDETDLIPTLESVPEGPISHKNGVERRRRKRVAGETNFKRFRRKSLISDGEALNMCSKIGIQRRKTIDSFTGVAYGRDIRDLKNDIMRLKNEADEAENKSLRCRLSLEKITNEHGINFGFKNERLAKDPEIGQRAKNTRTLDYRSPSWQPKVMLFRISKNELRKVLKSSKAHRRFPSKTSGDTTKRISCDLGNKVTYTIKKGKSDPDFEKLCVNTVHEFGEMTGGADTGNLNEEKVIDLSKLNSIKGSLTSGDPDVRKRKKSRFRNLHTKRKVEPGSTKDIHSSGESSSPTEPTLVDTETVFASTFKDCNRISYPQLKSPKLISIKDGDQKQKKKSRDLENGLHESSKGERRSLNGAETTHSQDRSKEGWQQDKHREQPERKDECRDRRERSDGREQSKHEEKLRESDGRKHGRHGSSHGTSRHQMKRSPSGSKEFRSEHEWNLERCSSGRGGKKWKIEESSPKATWVCEVCGFNEAVERVVHIKSHPFHCQSCHLAFKTEAHFINHLTKRHKDIRNQHHCLLCELSFDTEDQYQSHLETREHRHLESVEKNTINTLFTLLTGAPCPVLGLVEMRPEWLPNQAGTVHFYHQATPLSLALQYLKMHQDMSSFSAPSS